MLYLLERELKPVEENRRQELYDDGFLEREETELEVIFEKFVSVKYDRVWGSQIAESFLDVQRAVHIQSRQNLRDTSELFLRIYQHIAQVASEHKSGREFCEIWFSVDDQGNEKPEGIPIALADCAMAIFELCGWANLNLFHAIALKYNYNKRKAK